MDKAKMDRLLKNPDTRIFLEWSDDDAEFEVQFISPEERLERWGTLMATADNLRQKEKLKGYTSKQFFLDGQIKGKWYINLDYNPSEAPTYLKATTYFNYGKPSQKKEVRVFKLSTKRQGQYLFTIDTVSDQVLN